MQRNDVASRSSSDSWRSMKARMPSWSVSSAPAETSHTRMSRGLSRSISASETRTAQAVRLSLAPGTVSERHMSPTAATVPEVEDQRGLRQAPAPGQRPGEAQDRAGERAPPLRRLRLDPGDHGREALMEGADAVWSNRKPVCAASWWASTTRVWGASGIAGLGQDVHGLLLASHRPPEDSRPVQDLVG